MLYHNGNFYAKRVKAHQTRTGLLNSGSLWEILKGRLFRGKCPFPSEALKFQRTWKSPLDFDQLKIFFARATVWASPVRRNIFPKGSWSNAFCGQTFFFFVDKAANQAHIGFHGKHGGFGLKSHFTCPDRPRANPGRLTSSLLQI